MNNQHIDRSALARALLIGGAGVLTVGLVALVIFLDRVAGNPLPVTAGLAALGSGGVLALLGGELAMRPSRPISITQLVLASMMRSALVIVAIGSGIALIHGERFASDLARLAGYAFPFVLAVDFAASKVAHRNPNGPGPVTTTQ